MKNVEKEYRVAYADFYEPTREPLYTYVDTYQAAENIVRNFAKSGKYNDTNVPTGVRNGREVCIIEQWDPDAEEWLFPIRGNE